MSQTLVEPTRTLRPQTLVEPTRTLRLLGDGTHAEERVAGTIGLHDVDQDIYDLVRSYRRAYLTSVYSEPDSDQADEPTDRVAPACPCYSKL